MRFRQGQPACLVLDVAMPGIDGLAVQERLRHSGAGLPVIFLTGHGDIPMSVRAVKAGAEDFLTRPVNAADLLQAICAALQRASGRDAGSKELAALRERLGLPGGSACLPQIETPPPARRAYIGGPCQP
jgi:FixJ family two-component response regulator